MKNKLRHISIMIDSCAFYPPIADEKQAMERLWELDAQGIIQLEIAEATDEEMMNAPPRFRDRVNSRFYSRDMADTSEEQKRISEIQKILFPGKMQLADNDKVDVRNIFVATKYAIDFFVTFDKKHLISKAELIKNDLNVQVLTPIQCVDRISQLLIG